MSRQIAFAAIAICIAIPSVARADDWSLTQEFSNAQSSSIRIVEPEGYTVTVNGQTDTAPAVFQVGNANNYFNISLKSPDGATWSKKVEVKEYRQTVVRVKHVKGDAPAAPTTPKEKVVSFVGTIRNMSNNCKPEERYAIKLDFVMGPDTIKSVQLNSGAKQSVELPAGTYNIRRWQYEGNPAEWVFDKTDQFKVGVDGWGYDWGCNPPRKKR